MCERNFESPDEGLRIVIQSHLLQHASSVVVNALAGEPSLVIEAEDPAEWKEHRSAGGRQTAPGPELRAADSHLERHALLGGEVAGDADMEIWERREKALIISVDRVTPFVVLSPRFIVIRCPVTKRSHDPCQVMSVFASHVFLYERELGTGTSAETCGHK
jgi:hypothetical protein